MPGSAHTMSIKWMREDAGWQIANAEQTIRYPDKENPGKWKIFKRDLFNIADYVAVDPTGKIKGTIYVQMTIGMNNKAMRTAKIEASEYTRGILKSGNTIELHIWRKMGPRGKQKIWKLARFHAKLTRENAVVFEDVQDEGDGFEPVQVGFSFGDASSSGRVHAATK
jgi:hypothetical protein